MTNYRPVWAQIDLNNLDHNFRLVKSLAGNKVKILVPVKAHGYGHGLIPVSKRLEAQGVDYLGVAGIDEGIVLRQAGISKPILVLGLVLPKDINPLFEYHLTQTVCARSLALALNREAKRRRQKAVVHVKVDTGMNRIGVAYPDAYDFIKGLWDMKNIEVEGIFTHFPCADNNPDFTRRQIQMFDRLIRRLEKAGIDIPLRHTANSLGVIDYSSGHFNLIRPGLMIYGLSPKEGQSAAFLKLKPLLSLKTKIIHLNTVSKGEGISYGHSYITSRKSRIATLSVGYGDGYPRCLSNRASCLISGQRVKIVGKICMDQTMADVTGIKNVAVGDEVVLIGRQGKQRVTVEELAALAGTIPYEIVCNLGTRIRWMYKY